MPQFDQGERGQTIEIEAEKEKLPRSADLQKAVHSVDGTTDDSLSEGIGEADQQD